MVERSRRSAQRCPRRLLLCAAPRRTDLAAEPRSSPAARRALSSAPVLKARPSLGAGRRAPGVPRRLPPLRSAVAHDAARPPARPPARPRRASPRRPRCLPSSLAPSLARSSFLFLPLLPSRTLAHTHMHAEGELLRGSARFSLVHSERSDTLC